jgi:pimeloyl-ACP methyl ester carboxylesterase
VTTAGTWSEATLAGHPADVFEPARRNEHGYVVIYLHGVNLTRLAGNAAFTELFDRHGLPVVAPLAGPCWWADRVCPAFDAALTPERHVRQNVLAFIAGRWGSRPPRIALLGTSMGGQGALRMAYKYPDTFPVVAALSPAIDYQVRLREGDEVLAAMYDDEEQARQETATLHVHPLNWPRHQFFCCDPADERWHESAERLRMKLASLGIPHERDLETTGGGHGFAYYNTMAPKAIAFLAERLERERLRVV